MVKPPDPNEVGWKETVRMNPLEDAIVAFTPVIPTLPFKLPNSYRPLDVTVPLGDPGMFFNVDTNGNPVTVTNKMVNFGHEYVWHCHLLGHEENDMMRPMAVAVAPEAPANLAVTVKGSAATLTWKDNSLNETGFTIQRAADAGFTTGLVTFTVGAGVTTYTDTTYKANQTPHYYRVFATNTVGSGVAGYPSMTVASLSANAGPPAGVTTLLTLTQALPAKSPVILTWSYLPTGDQTGFTIQHATNSTFTTGLSTFTVAGNVTSFSDTSIKGTTKTYWYRVMPTNVLGNGAWSVNTLSILAHA